MELDVANIEQMENIGQQFGKIDLKRGESQCINSYLHAKSADDGNVACVDRNFRAGQQDLDDLHHL